MDDNKRPSVAKLARWLETRPLNRDVQASTFSTMNQTSPASTICPPSPSLATVFEKRNKYCRGTAGAEFYVEKEGGRMECGLCGKVYAAKKTLKIHMRLHYGMKPYGCSICPKAFAQPSVLKAHIAYHTWRRNWVCDICNKAFIQSVHLRTHRKTHSAQKDYECPYCQRCFLTKERCNIHVRYHTGERSHRYVCLLCGKYFTRGDAFRTNDDSMHRGLRPYICSANGCGKTFTRQHRLKSHAGSQHSAPRPEN